MLFKRTSQTVGAGVLTHVAVVDRFESTGKFRFGLPISDNVLRISARGDGVDPVVSLTILGQTEQ